MENMKAALCDSSDCRGDFKEMIYWKHSFERSSQKCSSDVNQIICLRRLSQRKKLKKRPEETPNVETFQEYPTKSIWKFQQNMSHLLLLSVLAYTFEVWEFQSKMVNGFLIMCFYFYFLFIFYLIYFDISLSC